MEFLLGTKFDVQQNFIDLFFQFTLIIFCECVWSFVCESVILEWYHNKFNKKSKLTGNFMFHAFNYQFSNGKQSKYTCDAGVFMFVCSLVWFVCGQNRIDCNPVSYFIRAVCCFPFALLFTSLCIYLFFYTLLFSILSFFVLSISSIQVQPDLLSHKCF